MDKKYMKIVGLNLLLTVNVISFVLAFAKMAFFCTFPLFLISAFFVACSMYSNSIYKKNTAHNRQKLYGFIAGLALLYTIGLCGFQIITRDGYCVDCLIIMIFAFILMADIAERQLNKYEYWFGIYDWGCEL